ncbi:transposable element Tcb1 transposase [Trichonephila clavipes]|nr:transposable element Tcb1 transposase [Trichonephila clavipes]
MWSMVAQRLTQITPSAATPEELWQRVKAAWSAVPQEHIQRLFESMPRRVAAVISNNGENASQVAEIAHGVYGADTVTANYVQFWFRRFR